MLNNIFLLTKIFVQLDIKKIFSNVANDIVSFKEKRTNTYFVADLALEGLDAGVDVSVLLEAGGGGEGLAALGARVAARADVLRADVALEVGRIGKYLK